MNAWLSHDLWSTFSTTLAAWVALGAVSYLLIKRLQRREARRQATSKNTGDGIEIIHDSSSYVTGLIISLMAGPIPILAMVRDWLNQQRSNALPECPVPKRDPRRRTP
jgi:hypothetical protein